MPQGREGKQGPRGPPGPSGPSGSTFLSQQQFSEPGSFEPPQGTEYLFVQVVAGGGGGRVSQVENNFVGGGGGGCGYSEGYLVGSLQSSYPVIVGAGGTSFNDGAASSFGSPLFTASGGLAGGATESGITTGGQGGQGFHRAI